MPMPVETNAESDIFTGPNYREIFVQHEQFFLFAETNRYVFGDVYDTSISTRPTAAEYEI